jgi:hypothetical protein
VDQLRAGDERATEENHSAPESDPDRECEADAGRRVAKRLATIEQADEAMLLSDRSLVAAMKANMRMREELIRLRPFWGQGVTKEEAVRRYTAAQSNPG